MKTIKLSAKLKAQIHKHASSDIRNEVCGLLGGIDITPERYYPISNIAEDKATRFLMDPEEQIRALREMRENSQRLCGIFHSHPSSKATPSPTDLELAAYPDVIYYISSLLDDNLQACYFNGEEFEPVMLC